MQIAINNDSTYILPLLKWQSFPPCLQILQKSVSAEFQMTMA